MYMPVLEPNQYMFQMFYCRRIESNPVRFLNDVLFRVYVNALFVALIIKA